MVRDERKLTARRAVEALRNGVPNRAAVETLGCRQPKAEAAFAELLNRAGDAGAGLRRTPLVDLRLHALVPVRRLAAKWCAEPSVHGGKRRPRGAGLVI